MKKFKPCPFCGGKVDFYPTEIDEERPIQCRKCGASVMFLDADSDEECLAAWNRRTDP